MEELILKVPQWMKIFLGTVVVVNFAAFVYFMFGSTANFQRGYDLVNTVMLVFFGGPSLILNVLAMVVIFKGWTPLAESRYVLSFLMAGALLFLAYQLVNAVSPIGWLEDNIVSDPPRMTSDQQYEYRIDIINPFQKNSREQLHIRQISTGKESNIPIDLLNEDDVYKTGMGDQWAWALLQPTEREDYYRMVTTEDLNMNEQRVYLVNVRQGAAERLK